MDNRNVLGLYRLDGTNQNITVAGTSAATTNAFGAQTRLIRVASTTNAYIKIAGTPTAVNTDPIVLAGEAVIIKVTPGLKLAALQVSAGGTMSVTELTA